MFNGLNNKLANVPTITGLSDVTADSVTTDTLIVDGNDVGSIIVQVPINTANIATLQQITTGQTYASVGDTTTFDNNVTLTAGKTMTADNFTGLASNSSQVLVSDNNSSTTYYPTFTTSGTGQKSLLLDSSTTAWSYKPDTGTLNAANIVANTGLTANALVCGSATFTTNAFSPSSTVAMIDSGTTNAIRFLPNAGSGAYNFLTEAGDSLIYAGNTAINVSDLTIASYSSTLSGIRLTPTTTFIGVGGASTTRTAGVSCSGTTVAVTGLLTATNFTGLASNATQVLVTDNDTGTTYYPTFTTAGTGQKSLLLDSITNPLSYVPSTSTLTCSNFSGLASNATTSANIALTGDDSSGSYFIPFSKTTSATSNALFIDNTTTPLSYNPNSSTLTCSNFSGLITNATTSSNVALTGDDTSGTYYLPFSKTTSATSNALFIDNTTTPLSYNPNSSTLSANNYTGNRYNLNTTSTSYLEGAGLNVNLVNPNVGSALRFNLFNGSFSYNAFELNFTDTFIRNKLTVSTGTGVVPTIAAVDVSSSKNINLLPRSGLGSFNPINIAGYSSIYAAETAIDIQTITMTTHASTTCGVRLTPTTALIGAGGTAATPTSNALFSGTTMTVTGNANFSENNISVAGTSVNFGQGAGGVTNLVCGNTNARSVVFAIGLNTIYGTNAGNAMGVNAAGNTCVGNEAGWTISSGQSNVCIGNDCGSGITTGSQNTFVGMSSGYQFPTTGSGVNNTAVGYLAGDGLLTTAAGNTLVGAGSGSANLTGSNNSFFGLNAGSNVSSGSNNIAIGNGASVPTAANSNQIAIGTTAENLYIQGGLSYQVLNITTTQALTFPFPQFYTLTLAAAATITLPAPILAHRGAVLKFKRNTGAFLTTITSTGAGLVFKAFNSVGAFTANVTLPAANFQTELICDGSGWYQITMT